MGHSATATMTLLALRYRGVLSFVSATQVFHMFCYVGFEPTHYMVYPEVSVRNHFIASHQHLSIPSPAASTVPPITQHITLYRLYFYNLCMT